MTVAVEREPEAVAGARNLGLPEPTFRKILLAGAPRFARELFGPVLGFYVALELGGLTAGIITATVIALAIEWYERKHGRRGALALVSAAFVVIQGVAGLVADSAVVYLAQPVIVSAIWGFANLVSAAIGRPLMGVFADAWYPFPSVVKTSRTYRRVFGLESIVWGVYLLARSGVRMLVLWTGSIGFFVAIQFVTGIPFIIALVLWSLWFAVRGFERSTEWDDAETPRRLTETRAGRKREQDEAGHRHRLRPEWARRRDRAGPRRDRGRSAGGSRASLPAAASALRSSRCPASSMTSAPAFIRWRSPRLALPRARAGLGAPGASLAPTRSTTGRQSCSSARSRRRRTRWAPTGPLTDGSSAPSSTRGPGSRRSVRSLLSGSSASHLSGPRRRGARPRRRALCRRARACLLRRERRALDAPARTASLRWVRARAPDDGPRGRVAVPPRRRRTADRGARLPARGARRDAGNGRAGRRSASGGPDPRGRRPARARPNRWPTPAGALPARFVALPARAGRVQGRLGAFRPIPWTAPEPSAPGRSTSGAPSPRSRISERAAWEGRACERPFVLLSQPRYARSHARHRPRGPTATCRTARPWT